MAVTVTNLTTGQSETDATSYTTASVSPSANKLLLLTVFTSQGNPAATTEPTITGNGLTWVLVKRQDDTQPHTGFVFRSMGSSPSSGTITIDFSGQTQGRCVWSLDEFSNVDTSGTNGSGAVVQSASDAIGGSQTSKTITLAAFESTANATYGSLCLRPTQSVTEGSGFSEVSAETGNTFNMVTTEFKDTNDTSVDWSWATNSVLGMAFGIEIKFSAGGGAAKNLTLLGVGS